MPRHRDTVTGICVNALNISCYFDPDLLCITGINNVSINEDGAVLYLNGVTGYGHTIDSKARHVSKSLKEFEHNVMVEDIGFKPITYRVQGGRSIK